MNTSENNHIYFELNPSEKRDLHKQGPDMGAAFDEMKYRFMQQKKAALIHQLKLIPKDELKSVLGVAIYSALQDHDYDNLIQFIKDQAADNKHLMADTIGPVLTLKILNL